jgi:hypothetical protein
MHKKGSIELPFRRVFLARAGTVRRRGSIELSFGMIFSIILIIALLGVATYAMVAFLRLSKGAGLAGFHQDFQADVDSAWASTLTNKIVEYRVPNGLTHACFGNLTAPTFNQQFARQRQELVKYASGFEKQTSNRFLYPIDAAEEFAFGKVEKIDLGQLSAGFDCFAVSNGRVRIRLIKEDFNPLVKIAHE